MVLALDEELLLVDDAQLAIDELTRFLEARGATVIQARNASEAIHKAKASNPKVVLMDIELGADSLNGIEAAQQIQRNNPYCSVIFVTAYDQEPHYRRLAVELKVRVAAWIPKPIVEYLDMLVRLIDKELKKSELRRSLRVGVDQKILPEEQLQLFLETGRTSAPEVVGEIVEELVTEKIVDVDGGIRLLYSALHHFVGRFAAEPGLREPAEILLLRLESLEKQEADEYEERFLARFRVKPGEVETLYDWGRSLLEE